MISFPCLFIAYPQLSLPHLPCQLSSCASLFPVPSVHVKQKNSESDLNQAEGTLSHKQPLFSLRSFIHTHTFTSIWLKRDIWGWERGRWERKRVAMKRSGGKKLGGVQNRRAAEQPPLSLCMVSHRGKRGPF